MPTVCLLFVVCVEIWFSLPGRALTIEGHAVLVAFWAFATGRTGLRAHAQHQHDVYVRDIAERAGVDFELTGDELEVLAEISRRQAGRRALGGE